MAYYSGTASSLADLRTALLTHAQADGWTLTGDVLSKAGVYFQITVDANNIKCLGCESAALANPAPGVVMMGKVYGRSGYPTRLISFPCNYEVFGFAQELYLVVNYDVDTYQWMAFGKSSVPGLPGQGGWCGSVVGSAWAGDFDGGTSFSTDLISIAPDSGGAGGLTYTSGALFWSTLHTHRPARNAWVNHGLDGSGWAYDTENPPTPIGIRWLSPLMAIQPTAWNSESVLLPLRAYVERPSYKSSLVADLANARHVRIDNLSPGDILTLGPDKWKVFPWYRKDSSARNGGTNVNHTGTFGWAIRYEGP